jgi:RNA polymerase sigma-70 factor, ECF subfamily
MHREPSSSTDEFLIYAIVAAQEEALLEIYHRYKRLVFSLAKRILRTVEDAEEVTQDVFVKIWKKALEYTPQKGSVSTWILTITHHSAIDALRKRNSRASLPVFEDELERIADTRETRDVLEQTVIQKAMQQLEPQEQLCIELAYFEGLSHSQLASKLELPLGSVKTRIRIGLQKLRDSLGDW